jgi:NAD(P)-dependent dehydrogenase (short-subunit alcohol dehydrogenase family)
MTAFDGKVALVTGGSSGIGRAAAHAFARGGARVVIAARTAERAEAVVREITESGGTARFVACDVARVHDVERLIAETVEAYGRLDCAFNNAATLDGAFTLLADISEEEYDRALANNLKSVWLCMRQEILQMLAQTPGGGAIVNTSSLNGLGGAPQAALYSAAKAGVLAFTKSAAQEYATSGIRVNALVAGAFRTPMLEGVFQTAAGGDAEGAKAVEERYVSMIPTRRLGTPEEAAAAAVWLCSDAASYVTGHSLIVDGGWSAALR